VIGFLISADAGGKYIKPVNIVAAVILALAKTASVARPQTKDVKRPAVDKVEKAPQRHQVANYPTMLGMTFWGRGDKNRRRTLPIGSIEEHGPNLPLATDSDCGVARREGDVPRSTKSRPEAGHSGPVGGKGHPAAPSVLNRRGNSASTKAHLRS
jgi:hypothetical protein